MSAREGRNAPPPPSSAQLTMMYTQYGKNQRWCVDVSLRAHEVCGQRMYLATPTGKERVRTKPTTSTYQSTWSTLTAITTAPTRTGRWVTRPIAATSKAWLQAHRNSYKGWLLRVAPQRSRRETPRYPTRNRPGTRAGGDLEANGGEMRRSRHSMAAVEKVETRRATRAGCVLRVLKKRGCMGIELGLSGGMGGGSTQEHVPAHVLGVALLGTQELEASLWQGWLLLLLLLLLLWWRLARVW